MYQEIRKSIHELGTFEDIVQDGEVMPAKTAIFCSEAGDVWNNHRPPFDVAKRCLYLWLRQRQVQVDFVTEADDLKAYDWIWLCDANVSQTGAKVLSKWVNDGGNLAACANAGMFDEYNRPNKALRELFGAEQVKLDEDKEPIQFERQDLPFARPITMIKVAETPVFGARSVLKIKDAAAGRVFKDGAPAETIREVGKGAAGIVPYLPGLNYLHQGLPKRPVDRGAGDDSMTHFLPTAQKMGLEESIPTVFCSDNLVESTVIRGKQGVVISLINWQPNAIKGLTVKMPAAVPTAKVTLASGRPVQTKQENGRLICTLDLDVADALILRP
jgi:hypothetical protein